MEGKKMNEKAKKILGIASFLTFIFIVVFVGLVTFSNKNLNMKMKLWFQGIENRFDGNVTTHLKQSIVEEESAVIEVVENSSPSVVSIVVQSLVFDPFNGPLSTEEGIGTGFVVSENGIVVTNSHVVDERGDYSVVLQDGTTYEVQKIHTDRTNDIAILEIDARGLTPLELGDSDSLKLGQKAIAIGNALGRYSNTVTLGVVSGIARQITAGGYLTAEKTYEDVIQTDAAVNPGNSGGPLLNLAGQVIGVNVATSVGADNISFAIASNTLKPILDSYFEEGRIVKPFLGVSYSTITEDIAKLRDFPEGAFVSRVYPDTPAEEAGIERGDIITKIGDQNINSKNSLSKVISRSKVGDVLKIIADREGESIELFVTLTEVPEELN